MIEDVIMEHIHDYITKTGRSPTALYLGTKTKQRLATSYIAKMKGDYYQGQSMRDRFYGLPIYTVDADEHIMVA